jgi:hypothetical protein
MSKPRGSLFQSLFSLQQTYFNKANQTMRQTTLLILSTPHLSACDFHIICQEGLEQ